jgi:hypothetical protein
MTPHAKEQGQQVTARASLRVKAEANFPDESHRRDRVSGEITRVGMFFEELDPTLVRGDPPVETSHWKIPANGRFLRD